MEQQNEDNVYYLLSNYKLDIIYENDLICVMCKNLMINAYQTHCGCNYCKSCISNYLQKDNVYCIGGKKHCKSEYLALNINVWGNPVLDRRISRLNVKCPNESCDHRTNLLKLKDHLRICNSKTIQYPYGALGCNSEMASKDKILNHLRNDDLSHAQLLDDSIFNIRNNLNGKKIEMSKKQRIKDIEYEELKVQFKYIQGEFKQREKRMIAFEEQLVVKDIESEELKVQLKYFEGEFKQREKRMIAFEEQFVVKENQIAELNTQIKYFKEELQRKEKRIVELEQSTCTDRYESKLIRAVDNKRIQRTLLENLFRDNNLLPNPYTFECPMCLNGFLPGTGVILRNCLHTFCKKCLEDSMAEVRFIIQMTCINYECNVPLEQSELLALINEDRLTKMMVAEASSQFFQCRNEDCTGLWDCKSLSGAHDCPDCGENNCMACQNIHTGTSCSDFRKTKRYISSRNPSTILATNRKMECFLCKNLLIQKGGCGSKFCDKCGNHMCIFTGKITGQHDPKRCYCGGLVKCIKIDSYCNCTPSQPCDKRCLYGCIDE